MKKSKDDFEKTLKKLEEIVEKLESGEETLESSILLYEEGIKLGNTCKEMLEKAKQKISVIDAK